MNIRGNIFRTGVGFLLSTASAWCLLGTIAHAFSDTQTHWNLNAFPQAESIRRAPAFADVPPTHWARRAIADAYVRQFFSGYPDSRFRPSEPITRVQAIAILANQTQLSSTTAPTGCTHSDGCFFSRHQEGGK